MHSETYLCNYLGRIRNETYFLTRGLTENTSICIIEKKKLYKLPCGSAIKKRTTNGEIKKMKLNRRHTVSYYNGDKADAINCCKLDILVTLRAFVCSYMHVFR